MRNALRNLAIAIGLGAGIQAAVIGSGLTRLAYQRRGWVKNRFVIGWMVQIGVLLVALAEAGRQSEREEIRETFEFFNR
jgi:hypothetical protein